MAGRVPQGATWRHAIPHRLPAGAGDEARRAAAPRPAPSAAGVRDRVRGVAARTGAPSGAAAPDRPAPLVAGAADEAQSACAWLFGYGSLIWRVDFPILAARPATVCGWARRFWQGSHDHRGTPAAPGRVATLVPSPAGVCVGVAYEVAATVFADLDNREKNGYQRLVVDAELAAPGAATVRAVAYVAPPGNPAYLGDAPLVRMAAHIHRAAGRSGRNADYVLELDAALRRLGAEDDHVADLARRLRRLARR